MKKLSLTFGFTLVELMVTLAVIGILSAIVFANFNPARATARDNVRKADLKSLQLALALYKAQNGRYPQACGGVVHDGTDPEMAGPATTDAAAPWGSSCPDYIVGLVPDFIAALPKDPKDTTNEGYYYTVDQSGSNYKLLVVNSVEVQRIHNYSDDYARCPNQCSGAECRCKSAVPDIDTYAVYTSGAKDW